MRILDVACGTAGFSLAAAGRIGSDGSVDGVDLSKTQLDYARVKSEKSATRFTFHRCSADAMPFEDKTFDAAISSLAFHEMPAEVRRGTILEIARVLKPGGFFALVDWTRPRCSPGGLFWLPLLRTFEYSADNWNNAYPALCEAAGLELLTDVYLRGAVRCQVFERVGGERDGLQGHACRAACDTGGNAGPFPDGPDGEASRTGRL